MFKQSALAVLFAALAAAAPGQLDERGLSCAAVSSVVSLMKASKVATPFCSSYLGIKETTTTSTITSTPCPVTTTTTISSTDTVTSTSVVTTSSTTTVYPVVAVSVTSTCGNSAQTTVLSTSTSPNQKRGQTTTKCTTTTTFSPSPRCSSYQAPPLGTPTCLTKVPASSISAGCSCLNIPTPTKVVFTTKTLATSTVTSTVCSTAKTTTTVTSTTTSVSTYSGTQYYTSTFTILQPPSSTITAASAPTQTFGVYAGQDFNGNDLDSFNCYPNSPPVPSGYAACNGFADCVNNCAIYSQNHASQNITCGAVLFSAPQDLSSGYCYLKTTLAGCGSPRDTSTGAVILPLVAYDPQ